MPEERSWEATIRTIVDQMARSGVTELEVQRGRVRLRLRRRASGVGPAAAQSAASPGVAGSTEEGGEDRDLHPIAAPLTGVFYAAPNPSARPYVEVGDWVEDGTVVGLIETMKVFNEVVSDCRGRVASILAEPRQLVQAGDAIVLVDRNATPDEAAEVTS